MLEPIIVRPTTTGVRLSYEAEGDFYDDALEVDRPFIDQLITDLKAYLEPTVMYWVVGVDDESGKIDWISSKYDSLWVAEVIGGAYADEAYSQNLIVMLVSSED